MFGCCPQAVSKAYKRLGITKKKDTQQIATASLPEILLHSETFPIFIQSDGNFCESNISIEAITASIPSAPATSPKIPLAE